MHLYVCCLPFEPAAFYLIILVTGICTSHPTTVTAVLTKLRNWCFNKNKTKGNISPATELRSRSKLEVSKKYSNSFVVKGTRIQLLMESEYGFPVNKNLVSCNTLTRSALSVFRNVEKPNAKVSVLTV